ncbi:uncharacterized protein [Equus caballus]|uniref:uncharacterized protein isoform X3 n=1 Tax=Equus caballus TaxID=9796 RepID=UPI0038B2E0CA
MITAQSVLLEREAQESSTTHDELAGQRAVNGSSERGGALSTPNYGEKKLPQVLIIGVKKGGTRAAGGDPSPPGGVGGGHRAALLRQELRKGARVVQGKIDGWIRMCVLKLQRSKPHLVDGHRPMINKWE